MMPSYKAMQAIGSNTGFSLGLWGKHAVVVGLILQRIFEV